MDKIKVLMLVPNLRVSNGVATFSMNYYRTMDHGSVKMDFVTYRDIESPYIDEIRENGDEVYVLPPVKNIVAHCKECVSVIRSGCYDIIHDNSLLITLPMMLIAKKHIGIRVLHSHSARLGETAKNEKRNKLFLPILLNTANCYAACSTKAGRSLFGDHPFTVIPNVIHAESFRFDEKTRESVRARENCGTQKIVGTVGRLTDAKNPYFAIDVMEDVLKRDDSVVYWWIGSGALDQPVAEYVRAKGLEDRIRLFGSRTDVTELLQAIDVFFMPSKNEGFGLACLEASATGLPCVVSDQFPAEVNVTGQVRFLSLLKRKEEWADALLEALDCKPDRDAAYARLLNSACTDTDAGKKLYEFYRKLLERQDEKGVIPC